MLSPSFSGLFSIISKIPFATTNYTYGEEAALMVLSGEATFTVRRHCTCILSEGEVTLVVRRHCTALPSEGEVTLIVRRHCTCFLLEGEVTLIVRRHCTCFISEGEVTLILRRHCTCFISEGEVTLIVEALYLLPILRCASFGGLCGGAALMPVPLVRAGCSHTLHLGTGTQNGRQSSTPCGN